MTGRKHRKHRNKKEEVEGNLQVEGQPCEEVNHAHALTSLISEADPRCLCSPPPHNHHHHPDLRPRDEPHPLMATATKAELSSHRYQGGVSAPERLKGPQKQTLRSD